jgi:hypothetical protein
MSIASSIAKFLHRDKTNPATTEAELAKVTEAVLPHVTSAKDDAVTELRDAVTHVGSDMKDAMAILSHEHKQDVTDAVATLEGSFEDIFKRFDELKAKLEAIGTDTAAKTGTTRKAAAVPPAGAAIKPTPAPAKDTPTK